MQYLLTGLFHISAFYVLTNLYGCLLLLKFNHWRRNLLLHSKFITAHASGKIHIQTIIFLSCCGIFQNTEPMVWCTAQFTLPTGFHHKKKPWVKHKITYKKKQQIQFSHFIKSWTQQLHSMQQKQNSIGNRLQKHSKASQNRGTEIRNVSHVPVVIHCTSKQCKILNPTSNLTSSLPFHHAQTQQSVLQLWNKKSMYMQVCYFNRLHLGSYMNNFKDNLAIFFQWHKVHIFFWINRVTQRNMEILLLNLMFLWPCIMNWPYNNYQRNALNIIYS